MNWTGGPLSRTRSTAHCGRGGPSSARQRQHFARARMKSNTRGRVPRDDIGYQSHSSDNEENIRFFSLPHLPWRRRKGGVSVGQVPRESYQSNGNSSVRKGSEMEADFVDTAATVLKPDHKVHKRGNRDWKIDEHTHDLANSRAGTSSQAHSLVIDSNLAVPVDGRGAESRPEDLQSHLSAFENARRLLLAREDWASTSLLHPPHFNFPGSDQRNVGRRRRVSRLPSYLARRVTRRAAPHDYELFCRDRRDRRSREKCRIKIGDSTPVDKRGQKVSRTQEAAMKVEEVSRNARVVRIYERLSEKGLKALLKGQRASSINRKCCEMKKRGRDRDQRAFDKMNHRRAGLESHHIVKLERSNLGQAAVRRSQSLDRPTAELVSLDILRKTTSSFPIMIDSSSRHYASLEEDDQSRPSCPHLDIGNKFHDQSANVENIASEPSLPFNCVGQQEFGKSPQSIKARYGHSPAHGSSSSGFSELHMAISSPPLFISRRDRRSHGESNTADEVLGQDGIGLVNSIPNGTQHVSLVSGQPLGGSRFCSQSDCMTTVTGPEPVNTSTDRQKAQGPSTNVSEDKLRTVREDGAWRRFVFDNIMDGDSLCASFQLESAREFGRASHPQSKALEVEALVPHYYMSSLPADADKCEKGFSHTQDKLAMSSGLSTPMPHTQRPPTSPLKGPHQRNILLEAAGDSTYLDNLLIGLGTLGQANEATSHAPFGSFGGSGFTASNDAPISKQRGSSTTKSPSVVINRGMEARRKLRAPLRVKKATKSTEKIGPIQEALQNTAKQTEDAEKPPSNWLFIRPPPFLAATSLAPKGSIRTQNHSPMAKTRLSNPRASRGCSPRQNPGHLKRGARILLTSFISRGDGWGNEGTGSREGWGMDEGVEGIDDD